MVHGNSTVKEDVVKALEGQDAVVVALGTRHDLSKNLISLSKLFQALFYDGKFLFRFYYCYVRQSEAYS